MLLVVDSNGITRGVVDSNGIPRDPMRARVGARVDAIVGSPTGGHVRSLIKVNLAVP